MTNKRPDTNPTTLYAPLSLPDTEHTDTILLSRLHKGDRRAFETLYARYYEPICRFLYRWVGGEADDLTQETFLRLYNKPPRHCHSDLGAWLHRVAINLAHNALRGRKRWEGHVYVFAQQTEGRGWAAIEPMPQAEVERLEDQSRVRRALGRLRERDAAILTLRYSGYSYREIAEVLEIAPGSVGTILARAERAFRRAFESLESLSHESEDRR